MLTSLVLSLSALTAASARPLNQSSWSGWSNVKYLIVFGDSYTQSGFNVSSTQPSPSNPLGNPAYPGYTSSNGPNWVDFLTYTYNTSQILAYNLAYGGATVDSALVTPYEPTVLSLKDQVRNEFLPTYSASPPWSATDSLAAFFIGINDVGNSWYLNHTGLYEKIFAEFEGLVADVYGTGVRNFLFLNVPPVNRAPLTLASGEESVKQEGAVIASWNEMLVGMTKSLEEKYEGTKTFVHDTHAVFDKIIDNPKTFEQTAGLKNVTGYCASYQNGTPDWDTFYQNCTYPVDEYMWLNSLHPTFPTHNATAADIVAFLDSQSRV